MMKKHYILFVFLGFSFFSNAQIDLLKKASEKAFKLINTENPLSSEEISDGLIEALIKGSEYSVNSASAKGGFNYNSLIRIPFPEEAKKMKTALIKIGFKGNVESFEKSINSAAELASEKALLILMDAIKQMSIKDALSILNGEDNAATIYLQNHTYKFLYSEFKPIVIFSMKEVQIAKQWNKLITKYNSIPLTKKINPDLEDYITNKTIEGLFILIAIEEKNIRENPKARITELLKKVFK